MFKNPWIRIWLLASFLWLVCFNIWAYQRWEKKAAYALPLLEENAKRNGTVPNPYYILQYSSYKNWVDKNLEWFWGCNLGPLGVSLVMVLGIDWIAKGFRQKPQ